MTDYMLENIQNNLEKLISAYETQMQRADKAETELEGCRKSLTLAQEKIKELEEKIDNLSLRTVFTSSRDDNAQAKAQIDSLINEIDRALAMLK